MKLPEMDFNLKVEYAEMAPPFPRTKILIVFLIVYVTKQASIV